MAIEVQVQQTHIDRGAQGEGNEFSCPFALALTEHFGETFGVGASTAAIVEDIEDEPGWKERELFWVSSGVATWTIAFDRGDPCLPVTLVVTEAQIGERRCILLQGEDVGGG